MMYSHFYGGILRRDVKYGFILKMRFLVLSGAVLGTALMLTSCSQVQINKPVPPKVFQYAYQEPVRTSSSASFAKQLREGKDGSLVSIRLANKRATKARLGRRYFSASGYECRKYTVQTQQEYASCLIGGRWLETSPVVHDVTQNLKN